MQQETLSVAQELYKQSVQLVCVGAKTKTITSRLVPRLLSDSDRHGKFPHMCIGYAGTC